MILDKAQEDVTIWPVVPVDDGYRGTKPGMAVEVSPGVWEPPEGAPIQRKAVILPTGFAGAGWAANQRYEDQGWAPISRATFYFKWDESLHLERWTRLEARGFEWTVTEAPRFYVWRNTRFYSALAEVRGED